MQFKDIRAEIDSYPFSHYIVMQKKGKNFVCPFCRSGEHKNGTSAYNEKEYSGKWHSECYSCGVKGDTLDMLKNYYGETEIEVFKRLRYQLDERPAQPKPVSEKAAAKPEVLEDNTPTEDEQTDYTEYFKAHQITSVTGTFAEKRGLNDVTVKRFHIGLDNSWRHPKAPTAPATPRLIIPTSKYSYLARDTRKNIPENQKPYAKSKVGSVHLFNVECLKTANSPIFIVEGELDAISLIQAGAEAIGLGSVSYKGKLIEALKKVRTSQPLLLALDSDERGRKEQTELAKMLDEIRAKHYDVSNILYKSETYKDANAFLMADKVEFSRTVKRILDDAEHIDRLYKMSAEASIDGLINKFNTDYIPTIIPTGFKKLDEIMNGGLRSGLVVVGAISSLGKTSYVIQMADYISKAGRPVLYVSLEMSAEELIGKIVSHNTYLKSKAKYGTFNYASSTIRVTDTHMWATYQPEAVDLLNESMAELKDRKLFIMQGVGGIGVQAVKEYADIIKKATGQTPVIVIDYFQLLAPYEGLERNSDKQIADRNIVELKRLSRDMDTPIIAISSFNRDAYKDDDDKKQKSMAAFKESGAIEYSADVLITLAKAEDETIANGIVTRHLEVCILKNRNGMNDRSINVSFVPMFNHIYEDGEVQDNTKRPRRL